MIKKNATAQKDMHLFTDHHDPRLFMRFVGIALFIIFALNLIWEIFQSPLYAGSSISWLHFFICLKAAAGDIILSLIVLMPFFILFKNLYLLSWKGYVFLSLTGIAVGILVEQYALGTGRWFYAYTMPLVPFFHVGLMPTLQLGILTPLAIWITQQCLKTRWKIATY